MGETSAIVMEDESPQVLIYTRVADGLRMKVAKDLIRAIGEEKLGEVLQVFAAGYERKQIGDLLYEYDAEHETMNVTRVPASEGSDG